MARTSATISVGADTRQLERDIQRALGRDFKFKGLNEKAFTQPLGRITGASNEFQKSLDASNARVIAFGASAGLIYTVEKAFSSLVRSTIDVQKSLTDINVILNVSAKSLSNFGSGLFDIAKNTGQSFDAVARAATEFSRQGLGLEATLKRTKDALILTRLSGLDTVASVEALTATINSFSNAALDSTTIINKLANVDAAFAVSSADLAEAIKRVGSSAQDVGVDFDELLAIVTSVQQTTARGGAVIGNSLKTIFTRIQRTDTLDQLEQLGIQVRTLEGSTLPAIQILSNLANTFGTLGDNQRAQVAETVGGVFQINILKAALADLGKEYSVYNNALKTSANASNEAIKRNEALNQTLSSLINKTFVNLTKLGSDVGKISFGPTIENLLNLLNKGLENIDLDGKGLGSKIAKDIFETIGSFIAGPGVVLLTAVVTKLVFNLGKFAAQSLQALLNLNTKAQERVAIQTKINQVLSQEPGLVQAVYNKELTVLDIENKILNIIRQQTIERQKAASIATAVTGGLIGKGVTAKGGVLKAKSGGFVPNFAMSEIFGALAGGYNPGSIKRMSIPGEGPVTYNSAETVKRFAGMTQPAIMPPQASKAGKNYQDEFKSKLGFNPYASAGFIPNFNATFTSLLAGVQARKQGIDSSILKAQREGKLTQTQVDQLNAAKTTVRGSIAPSLLAKQGSGAETREFNGSTLGVLSLRGRSGDLPTSTKLAQLPMFSNAIKNDPSVAQKTVRFNGVQVRSLDSLDKQKPNEFIRLLTEKLLPPLADVATEFVGGALGNQGDGVGTVLGNIRAGKSFLPPGAIGDLFETVIKIATKNPKQFLLSVDDDFRRPFDFEESGAASGKFKTRFGFKSSLIKADAKLTSDNDAIRSIIKKAYNSRIDGLPFTDLLNTGTQKTSSAKRKSKGFIPNFSALNDALDREITAGVSPSRVRIGKDKRLTSASNPLGLGVYNTKDEPLGLGQGISRVGSKAKTAGAANGFVPNFAAPLLAGAAAIAGNSVIRFAVQQAISAALIYGINKIVDTVNSRIEGDKNKQIVSTVGQAAQFGIGTALLGGGAKVGAGIALSTLIPGLINALGSADQATKDLIAASENNKDTIQEFNSALGIYNANIEKLKDETISSVDQQKILAENNEALTKILLNTPDQLRDNLKTALSGGDSEKITQALSQVQVALQVSAANTDNLAKITQITSDKSLKPEEFNKLSTSILSLQNERGVSVASSVMSNPQILKNFQKSLQTQPQIIDISNRELADEVGKRYGYRIDMEGTTGYANKGRVSPFAPQVIDKKEIDRLKSLVLPDVINRKTKELDQANSNQLVNSIENLLKDSEISEPVIKSVIDPLRNVPFEDASKEIENLNKVLEDFGFTVVKTNKNLEVQLKYLRPDILRRASLAGDVSANLDSASAFRKSINAEALKGYSEFLDNQIEFNPNRIAAGKVLDAQEGIYSSILNETERRKVNAKFIEQTNNLHKKGVIDLDKFISAVQGSQEELIALNQRARGLMFAEDFRGARQAAREKRILGGDTKLEDFPAAFFDEFDNRTEDSYREAQMGAKETARTIKSEFNNAFLSFANGTETASDAFTKMALNISDKIQQLALEFATNQIFGSLFGSTSNIFGGGGGGIGDFFGSLFKSKGGIIKGYSSGGNVTGGSGTKDDVPAMLSAGEYVIRKNAVKKYGPEYLQMLNEGKVQKHFFGGALSPVLPIAAGALAQSVAPLAAANPTGPEAAILQSGFFNKIAGFMNAKVTGIQTKTISNAIAPVISPKSTSPSPTYGTGMGRMKDFSFLDDREDDYFKYGGRVQKFAGGGEAQFFGENVYRYNDPFKPTGGNYVADPRLSYMAVTDPNNPQNKINQERERNLYDYLNYVEGVRLENERSLQENIELNKKIRDEYNQQKSARSRGAWMSFGLGLIGAGASQFSSMGGFKGVFGSQSKYGASAALGGGSAARQNYARSAPLRYSTPTPRANGGYIRGFANGGSSGKDDIPALLMGGEFVMRKEAVNNYGKKFFDDLNSGRAKKFANGGIAGTITDENKNISNSTNNVNITINIDGQSSPKTSMSQDNSNENSEFASRKSKSEATLLANKIKAQVLSVINEQQRPGGLLSSSVYKKIN